MLYKSRNKAIIFYDDCSLMAFEAKNKAKNKTSGKGLTITYTTSIELQKWILYL